MKKTYLVVIGGVFALIIGNKILNKKVAKKAEKDSKMSNEHDSPMKDLKGLKVVENDFPSKPDPKKYLELTEDIFKKLGKKYGIPWEFLATQTGLETGFGSSSLTRKYNNFGGVKAKEGDPWVRLGTTEYTNDLTKWEKDACPKQDWGGKWFVENTSGKGPKWKIFVYQKFKVYPDFLTGLEQHTKVLLGERYKPAFAFPNDWLAFAREIKKAGYATDPNYITKLQNFHKQLFNS